MLVLRIFAAGARVTSRARDGIQKRCAAKCRKIKRDPCASERVSRSTCLCWKGMVTKSFWAAGRNMALLPRFCRLVSGRRAHLWQVEVAQGDEHQTFGGGGQGDYVVFESVGRPPENVAGQLPRGMMGTRTR